jgi:hypothetical protein
VDETRTVAILSALANGVNPLTGEIFGTDSPYQQAEVVRALFAALERFKSVEAAQPKPSTKSDSKADQRAAPKTRADAPSNVGKPWTEEEDRRLLAGFDQGRKPAELAREFGRTLAGIEARLERHGKLSAQQRTTANRYPRERPTEAQPISS